MYAYPDNDKRNTERKSFSQEMLNYLEQVRKGEIIMLFEDESIFTLFGEVGYSWSPVGEPQEVPLAGKRGRVVVLGLPVRRRDEPITGSRMMILTGSPH